jgi:hypothetical protein
MGALDELGHPVRNHGDAHRITATRCSYGLAGQRLLLQIAAASRSYRGLSCGGGKWGA